MARVLMTTAEILDVLERNPVHIAVATRSLSPELLTAPAAPGEWSLNEILAHLRGYADTRGDRRIMTMISEDSPTIRTMHPNKWAAQEAFPDCDFRESLDAFTGQRGDLIDLLRRQPESVWTRTATITGAGAPRVKSVHETGDALARHERAHVRHIAKVAEALQRKHPD
ncbi:MAG: DinB family protein [Thermomicrobiales bacterium]|nr:DinB family protein [Thermomicrobiales bacterium]